MKTKRATVVDGHLYYLGQETYYRTWTYYSKRDIYDGSSPGWYSGYLTLIVRKARAGYECERCAAPIPKGELHASSFYTHVCLGCVTPAPPPRKYQAKLFETASEAPEE